MKIAFIDLLGLTYDGNTLNKKGLGGSESAVILLSKELSNIGFDVTVYNNCSNNGVYDNVRYIDHSLFTDEEDYDVVISSRSVFPFFSDNQYARLCNSAKYKVLWMHDTFCEGDEHLENMVIQGFIDEIFTLSDFHTTYISNCDHGGKRNFEVLKHKIFQTRNGAVKHIKEVDLSNKDPCHFVYNASATKGLEPLIKLWPRIKQAIPAAHLTCIGGFYKFKDNKPDEQEMIVQAMINDPLLKTLGVTFTGIISQKEIAEILANASLMLYPTAFPETFGISSLESLLYKTPIVTNIFGALEETAINQACYKMPYSSTNNALFNNINEEEQENIFIETVISAFHNTYLLQQKQNYCDILDDIYSWNTVALQWKQHLFAKLGRFLDVESYRKVSYINDKVTRVFGRRFNNVADRRRYTSYDKQRRIVIITPFYNAEKYIANCINSVAQQDYDNYVHMLIDDASTDSSKKVVQDAIRRLPPSIQRKFQVHKNTENNGAIANQLWAFERNQNDNDIFMLLDGDDWLVNNNSIFHFYNHLYSQNFDFSYGSMYSLVDKIPLIAQSYPAETANYRKQKFNWGIPYTHLRTFKSSLTKTLDRKKFIDSETGEYIRAGADNPLFYELIERAENPIAVKEIMVNYNDLNPLNDYKVRSKEQNRNAKISYG